MTFPEPCIPISSDGVFDLPKILCPYCKFNYVHIGSVSYGPSEYAPIGVEVTSKAMRWDHAVPCHGRGDRVYIEFWGECGHRFGLLIQHHKGETFVHRIDLEGQPSSK